jgi:hypothetical protein
MRFRQASEPCGGRLASSFSVIAIRNCAFICEISKGMEIAPAF